MLAFVWPHGCSGRRRARPPARLGGLTSFGAAPRSPPVPSGPSGALHTSGARCADVRFGASARCPARPCHPPAPRPCPPDPPAPSTPVGPGRCSAARHVGSLSGQAPPPPTGTAAWPPHPRLGHTSAKKFAQHRQDCPKSANLRSQGEFFRADGSYSYLKTPAYHLT